MGAIVHLSFGIFTLGVLREMQSRPRCSRASHGQHVLFPQQVRLNWRLLSSIADLEVTVYKEHSMVDKIISEVEQL
jgi:hypothetical protein